MESADCPRTFDSEQSMASSNSVTVKCEAVVKVEPEWDECGAGEAAPQTILYADHEVKDELMVFGPEILQQQDIASPVQNVVVKQEKHLCKLEPPDGIKVEPDCTYTCPRDEPRCSMSLEQRFKLRSCFVRLERIPLGDLLSNTHKHTRSSFGGSQETPGHQVSVLQEPHQMADKSHSCGICYKKFGKQSDLTRHIRIHTGEKPYSCDLCHKRFADQSRLSRHIRIHKDEKQLSCDKCDKQFVQESDLKKHALTHMGEKPHSCSICYKKFAKQSDLTRHIRIHTGEKPYNCDTCHKRFSDQSRLSRHIKVHNGVKLHRCNICHKRFTQKSHLNRHALIHTGEKPFTCDMCHKQFNQKATLICHIRTHTGEKPFVCHICDKRFVEKCHLARHIQAHKCDKTFAFHIGMRQSACPKIDNDSQSVVCDDSPLLKIHKIGKV